MEHEAAARELGLMGVAEVELPMVVILSLGDPITDTTVLAMNVLGILLAHFHQLTSGTHLKGTRVPPKSAGISLDAGTFKGVAEVDLPVGVSPVILPRTAYTPK